MLFNVLRFACTGLPLNFEIETDEQDFIDSYKQPIRLKSLLFRDTNNITASVKGNALRAAVVRLSPLSLLKPIYFANYRVASDAIYLTGRFTFGVLVRAKLLVLGLVGAGYETLAILRIVRAWADATRFEDIIGFVLGSLVVPLALVAVLTVYGYGLRRYREDIELITSYLHSLQRTARDQSSLRKGK